MKRCFILLFIFLLLPLFPLYGRDNIVFYQIGDKDPVLWNGLKKYLTGKGYGVILYQGTDNVDQQISNANKITREKAALFLVAELVPSEKEDIFIAIPNAKRGKGKILEIDEIPAVHSTDSEELALSLASPFGVRIKRLPLFAFLGIDMPGAFLKVYCPKEKTRETFNKLNEGLQKYFARGEKDENER